MRDSCFQLLAGYVAQNDRTITLWTQSETYSIQENGGQQYGGQQKYVSAIKQTHNGGGLERPVMEKKRSMIAFHEGN
ncbi:hypothetical protein NC651_035138 [Populus alba x Populus x berolinensis]|nr:hypothetical protein NC651_035138 [Populus alba x Populus x berolinensis]